MKLFKDYKTQLTKKYLYSYFFILIILMVVFLISPFFSFGQTKEDLENQINNKSVDILKLEEDIKKYQNELNTISKQKNTLANTLKEIEINRKKLILNISLTENKIEQTNLKIQNLSSQINDKEDSISLDIRAIKSNFRLINEAESKNLIQLILNGENITAIWNDIDQMFFVREKIREKVVELRKIKGELESVQTATEKAKEEMVNLKNELADERKIVEQNKKEQETLLTKTKNSEANYQKLLKDKKALRDALEKELRDYESQLKFILDPNSLPGAGVLSWPLDKVFVTQQFGVTSASKRLYASGSHSGTDFRASVGTPVKAMAEGVVKAVGDTDTTCAGASFGKWILIDYNNGLSSAYGHMSLIRMTPGQKVSRGEIVGYSGNTGHTTGPHLHVTVYVKNAVKVETRDSRACPGKTLTQPFAPVNAYLDPMYYLPKY
jgi:murein DD-endopeptidase MepM/ murein hydrolase activator NlpD